jgi:hypothetical protein
VLTVLAARGIEVAPDVRDRILASTDLDELDELDRWVQRAATVSAASELFD